VIAYARGVLDMAVPLAEGASHRDATGYELAGDSLRVSLAGGRSVGLARPVQFAGFQGEASAPSVLLFASNGLHLELRIDRAHAIGRDDPAGIADLVLESAITTIMDARTRWRRWTPTTRWASIATGSA